jgi:chorismate mutase
MNNETMTTDVVEDVNDVTEPTEETASVSPQDYAVMRDMMKEMDEWNKMLKDETHSILKNNYGLTNFAVLGIIPYTDEKISSMTLEEVKDFFEKYKDENVHNTPDIETLEEGIQYMREIKDLQMNLYNAEQESAKLKEQSQDILNDYFEFLNSPKVVEARRKRLENMKALAEAETDEGKRYSMMRMINSMEQADNMEFIFKRFYEDAVGESKRVAESFFDERRGSYVIQRYKDKITKFGFDVNLYKYFFNLEENFLNEKYHAFNNLFLFYYMRFVGHARPHDKTYKLFVQSITSAMANMIYHKFNSTTEEQRFIHIIEKFENDFFMDQHDYFMENNTTRPGHPVREVASAKYEADQKARLIAKMCEMGITGYDETMSAKDMQKFFNEKMDEMLAEQKRERDAKSVVIENEDGSVTVEPNMKTEFVTGTVIDEIDEDIDFTETYENE